jgi:hemerythrin-like domain-containing protein
MTTTNPQARRLLETRLVHTLHRNVSTLLAEAAARREAEAGALVEIRDFLVGQLRSHHESEDRLLWPMLTAKVPGLSDPFAGLTGEHEKLDAVLDALAAAPADEQPERTALIGAAAALRDQVHTHLEHEEGVLFPALLHVTEQEWEDFAAQVIAETPNDHPHLLVGFLEQAGTPQEADVILAAIPAPVREALRAQFVGTLARLGG